MEQVCLDKKSITELAGLVEEIQLWLESLELSNDPEFMESLRKSEEEIKKGDVVDFDEL
tara:strand:- start:414 stop:590 length:177 start_codon:yes stop_codon:yes gene_type:complete